MQRAVDRGEVYTWGVGVGAMRSAFQGSGKQTREALVGPVASPVHLLFFGF